MGEYYSTARDIELRGGDVPHEGNIWTWDPRQGIWGPVCDDCYDIEDVSS